MSLYDVDVEHAGRRRTVWRGFLLHPPADSAGAVLAVLRDAAAHAVALDLVAPDWSDAQQRDRAIDSLIADGLAEASDGMLRLPR